MNGYKTGDARMKHTIALTVTSVLSVLLFTLHLAQDIVRGIEKGDASNFGAFPIFVIWLYGTLVLAERRSGYIIMLLGSLLGSVVPIVHMMGRGVGIGSRLARFDDHFFFVWTLIALGVTAMLSVILSTQGLWRLRRSAVR